MIFSSAKSCSHLKQLDPAAESAVYNIHPFVEGNLTPFDVACNMTDKNGVGVTVISHDSESRTSVQGYEEKGRYSRDIHYTGASLSQLQFQRIVNNLLGMSVTVRFCGSTMILMDGGYHVTQQR